MPALLSLFLGYLILARTYAWEPSLGPGLSLKNGILYLLLVLILMRGALNRDLKLEMRGIFVAFSILLGYIALSTAVVTLFVQYPGYKLMTAVTQAKGLPFDFMAFFAVYFLGTRTRRDAVWVMSAALVTAIFANVVSGLDAVGIMPLDTINDGETLDRVQGVIGEHNQYGAYLAFFLPLLIAAVVTSRGMLRLFWLGGALVTFVVLMMTVSRGAFVALVGALLIGGFMFRQYLLNPKMIGWIAGGAALAVAGVAVVLLATPFGGELINRLFGESTSVDMWQVSSGRTELWKDAVDRMMREPVTLLTGFGWATYFVLPSALPLAPHNTYLWYWFEIGLVGVGALTALLLLLIVKSAKAAQRSEAQPADRAYFIAFCIGTIALSIAIFFVEIYNPWPYFWAVAGVVMRMVVLSRAEQEVPVRKARIKVEEPAQDRFGWSAAPVTRGPAIVRRTSI
jgi:hypothetical protein